MLLYKNEILEETNVHSFFLFDECLFSHSNNKQIWLIGIIDNKTKDFRSARDIFKRTICFKKNIIKYVKKGNCIVTLGFLAYNFLNSPDSG